MAIDAHKKPPGACKSFYKRFQNLQPADLGNEKDVVDFERGLQEHQRAAFRKRNWLARSAVDAACADFVGTGADQVKGSDEEQICCFESVDLPGLVMIPRLLPLDVQRFLLDRSLHRDLSNPAHKTNVHFHHDIKYPEQGRSFFDLEPMSSDHFSPFKSLVHKPLTVQQFLGKKLRWMTLGGQYDWTNKRYPDEEPPPFPKDLQELLRNLFPQTVAEAAILNVYSPGDVLSLHRDVSEFCDPGLISISIGCDGLFMLAIEDENENDEERRLRQMIIRLRSGDSVYMSGPSRFAWHGVPLVVPNTCPEELQAWPGNENWRGWLSRKRINLNVRQMFDQ